MAVTITIGGCYIARVVEPASRHDQSRSSLGNQESQDTALRREEMAAAGHWLGIKGMRLGALVG